MKLTNSKQGGYKNKVTPNKNKTLRAVIISSILTAILTGTIAVAAVSLTAKDIPFVSTNEEWKVDNVEDAMNDLFKMEQEITRGTFIKLSETPASTFSINVGDYYDGDLTKLSEDNFLLSLSTYTSGVGATDFTDYGNGGHRPWGANTAYSITKSYDPSTGVFTCKVPENYTTSVSGPWTVVMPSDTGGYKNRWHYAKLVSRATVIPYLVITE